MNRALVPVGRYAENPFYIDKVFVNVYSSEELCYVLYENAFLLDREIMDIKLAGWIEKELGLPELSRELYRLINAGGTAAAFVGTILSYVGFYSEDEVSKAESILRLNVSMNAFEKMKAKADFLVENKHFILAIKEYEKLLSVLPEDETELKSRIYNNMGITYMNLYLYESAEKCFLSAYETNNDETAYIHYLTVKRMSLSEEEYIKMVADEAEAYRLSISLETRLEEAKHGFEESDAAVKLKELFELKDSQNSGLYYEEMKRITEGLKEDYRDIVLDTERTDTGTENI